jgi:hypothetical protein
MVYRTPNDKLTTDKLATHEDETLVLSDHGNNMGTALLAGVLIVVAVVLIVWLLGGSDVDPTGTTFSPVETTLPVGTGAANPTAPG